MTRSESFIIFVERRYPLIKNPFKHLGTLLGKENLAEKHDLLLRHDLINNTLSAHWKNDTTALYPEELVEILEEHNYRKKLLVYFRRFRTEDICKIMKDAGIMVIRVRNQNKSNATTACRLNTLQLTRSITSSWNR